MQQNNINNPLVSLFYIAKISRNRNKLEIEQLFNNSYQYNKEETIKLLFYIGDIKGLNERRFATICYKWLIQNDKDMFIRIFPNLMKYNRYDILFHFLYSDVEKEILQYIKETIINDLNKIQNNDNNITYLGKWLPNINSKNVQKKELAKKISHYLGWDVKTYRKNVSLLKNNLDLVEIKMSNNEWKMIDTNTISNQSFKQYKKSFDNHNIIMKSKENIEPNNYKQLETLLSSIDIDFDKKIREISFKQLKNIDNFSLIDKLDYIPVINTSLSMFHSQWLQDENTPIKLSIILSYYALKHKNNLNNIYFDFNNDATINTKPISSINDLVNRLESKIDNINIKNLYENLLNFFINKNYPINQPIPNILIITDNPFNSCVNNSFLQNDIYDEMFEKYKNKGYKIPNIVFWNVNNKHFSQHSLTNKKGIIMINGYHDDNLNFLFKINNNTPYETLLNTINNYSLS